MEKQNENIQTKRQKLCPICGRTYEGYGNNPDPLNFRGQVCDECNAYVVIPTRLALLQYTSKLKK